MHKKSWGAIAVLVYDRLITYRIPSRIRRASYSEVCLKIHGYRHASVKQGLKFDHKSSIRDLLDAVQSRIIGLFTFNLKEMF